MMLDKIKREITYIKANQYGFITKVTINDKEYCENEVCIDGTYTVYPESLDDQLQRLIPDIDIEIIERFVDNAKKAVTPDDIKRTQDKWDAFVRIQENRKMNTSNVYIVVTYEDCTGIKLKFFKDNDKAEAFVEAFLSIPRDFSSCYLVKKHEIPVYPDDTWETIKERGNKLLIQKCNRKQWEKWCLEQEHGEEEDKK